MKQKSQILSFILAFFSIISYSQEFPTQISEKHIQISGTNIFMIPPPEFELSNNFKGLQNSNDLHSMIMIIEIPGPFSEVSKGFTQEMVGKQGMILNSKQEVSISNHKGYLINLNQKANGIDYKKYILAFGDEKKTTLVNGMFPTENSTLEKLIRTSIQSTFVNENILIDHRNELNYNLDESLGNLKFVSVIGNGMLFNRDMKTPTESGDKATIITDKSYAKLEIANQKMFCISRLKKYPDDFSIIVEKGINEIEIDNLKGYEIYANNNDKIDEEMYQVILFEDDGGYYLFVGTYLKNNEEAKADIKKVIQSFKRKL